MPVICLGPVCVPIYALLPFLLALLARCEKIYCPFSLNQNIPSHDIQDGFAGKGRVQAYLGFGAALSEDDPAMVGEGEEDDNETKNIDEDGDEYDDRPHRVLEITSIEQWNSQRKESVSSGRPLFVDFTATWCKPCQKIAPIFESLSKRYPKSLFVKIDVDVMDEIAHDFNISAMPTFQVHRGGAFVDEVKGNYPEKLKKMVRRHGMDADPFLRRLRD